MQLNKLKELALRGHYYCDDGFYSCPLADDYCGNAEVIECKCGADEHNAEVEKVFVELEGFVKKVGDCESDCHQLCTDEGVPSSVWDVIEDAKRMVKNELV